MNAISKRLEKSRGVGTVERPMVEREIDGHATANGNVSIVPVGDDSFADAIDSENGDLWGVADRTERIEAQRTEVRYRERASLQMAHRVVSRLHEAPTVVMSMASMPWPWWCVCAHSTSHETPV